MAEKKMGMSLKKRKRRIPLAKRGGFLLPAVAGAAYSLTALRALRALRDRIQSKNEKGLYLHPPKKQGSGVKRGKGVKRRRKGRKKKKRIFF